MIAFNIDLVLASYVFPFLAITLFFTRNRFPLTLDLSLSIAIKGETFERRICPAYQDVISDGVLRKVGSGATIRECGILLEWSQLREF